MKIHATDGSVVFLEAVDDCAYSIVPSERINSQISENATHNIILIKDNTKL